MPPEWLTWSFTAVIAIRTGARKLAPGPSSTTVAASLMLDPETPTSVEPPFFPEAHAKPGTCATPPVFCLPPGPALAPIPVAVFAAPLPGAFDGPTTPGPLTPG